MGSELDSVRAAEDAIDDKEQEKERTSEPVEKTPRDNLLDHLTDCVKKYGQTDPDFVAAVSSLTAGDSPTEDSSATAGDSLTEDISVTGDLTGDISETGDLTEGWLKTMKPHLDLMVDAYFAIDGDEVGTEGPLGDYLQDYVSNLELYRWLDHTDGPFYMAKAFGGMKGELLRETDDKESSVEGGYADESAYVKRLLADLEGMEGGPSDMMLKYAIPILLSKQNCNPLYYASEPIFLGKLFTSMTDLLFEKDYPGARDIFLRFISMCKFSDSVLKMGVPRGVVVGAGSEPAVPYYFKDDSDAYQEIVRRLENIETNETTEEDTDDKPITPGPDRSCEGAKSQFTEQLRRKDPVELGSEMITYLTMCEENRRNQDKK